MGETSLRLVRDAGTGWDGLCAGVFTTTGTNVLCDVVPKNPVTGGRHPFTQWIH